jgi:rod shape determining protein RodA
MLQFDRRLLENFEWVLLGLVLLLAGLGILNLYSASSSSTQGGSPVWIRQLYWAGLGLGVLLVTAAVDYRWLDRAAWLFYGVAVVMLVLVLVMGATASGAQRWIDLGFTRFQPSELSKLAVITALAHYCSRRRYPTGMGLKELWGPGLLVLVPFLLIVDQPDLGTALHLSMACGTVFLYLRIRRPVFWGLVGVGVFVLPFGWAVLHDYQRRRILTFLDPERDPLGSGYHIIQSKIAVGSGQFWGKGFLKGTQSQLRFLPEQHTDFAFSVFAEEWGFIGSAALLVLFFLFFYFALRILGRSKDRFGQLLGMGLIGLIFWQFFINVGMVTGLMPVVGLPLPFISYGGTSLVTIFMSVGLLLNIGMRRYLFQTGAPVASNFPG